MSLTRKFPFILRLNHIALMLALAVSINASGCSQVSAVANEPEEVTPDWLQSGLWSKVYSTSPITKNLTDRLKLYDEIQTLADGCSNAIFKKYMTADAVLSDNLEKSYPILQGYDIAFSRVLDGVKNDVVPEGEVAVWHLYNMGYVVKTADGAFAIDIYHRRAQELAPYINFYAITHRHTDHKSEALAREMSALGKPVLSNFTIEGVSQTFVSDVGRDYKLGVWKLHTFITNHNNSADNVPITVFKIDLGPRSGNCILMHSGDSNFRTEQFSSVQGDKVDIYIPRYAQTDAGENAVIGKVIAPRYTLLSHILELYHESVEHSRWPLRYGLNRVSKLDTPHAYMPFWGDKMIWKNGILK